MSTATLIVEPHGAESYSYLFNAGSAHVAADGPRADVIRFDEETRAALAAASVDGSDVAAIAARFAAAILPTAIEREIRRWAAGTGEKTLLVQALDEPLARLLWETLPGALGLLDLAIARVVKRETDTVAPRPRAEKPRLLVIGSPYHRGAVLHGIMRELAEIPSRFGTRATVIALNEPTDATLRAELASPDVHVIHLSPATVRDNAVLVRDEVTARWLDTSSLAAELPGARSLRLVVVNGCATGAGTARALCESTGATTLGWLGNIGDQQAADFALFLYARLLEGLTVAGAIRSFLGSDPRERRARGAALPVLWLPSPGAEATPIFEKASEPRTRSGLESRMDAYEPDTDSRIRGGRSSFENISGTIRRGALSRPLAITLDLPSAINPALLKNNQPALQRLTIEAPNPILDARLQIDCETGNGTSTFRQTLALRAELNDVPTRDIHFPALHALIHERMGRRIINFTVRLFDGEKVIAEVTRSTQWMAANEWVDGPDTWPFIPSFVLPESSAVRAFYSDADVTLKKIGEPTDSFYGYQGGDTAKVRLQMRAIFQTLRDDPYRLAYINPPSSPVYMPGLRRSSGQLVRDPDEILKQKRGTCHDLTLLFASCSEHVGIYPLVVLIKGHTFFGFWKDSAAHRSFWRAEAATGSRANAFGAGWTIRSADTLKALLDRGEIELVEATMVTNPTSTFEAACAVGADRVRGLGADDLDAAVDVRSSRYMIQSVL